MNKKLYISISKNVLIFILKMQFNVFVQLKIKDFLLNVERLSKTSN